MRNKLTAAAETDTAAETEGAWFEYSPRGDEVFRVKMARAGNNNADFGREMEKRVRPFRAGVRDAKSAVIPPHIERKINAEVYARTVVKDWNADDVGEPFSIEACIQIFMDAPDFLAWVMNASSSADSFRKQVIAENAGN